MDNKYIMTIRNDWANDKFMWSVLQFGSWDIPFFYCKIFLTTQPKSSSRLRTPQPGWFYYMASKYLKELSSCIPTGKHNCGRVATAKNACAPLQLSSLAGSWWSDLSTSRTPILLQLFLWDRLPINSIIQVVISRPLCRKNLTFANRK